MLLTILRPETPALIMTMVSRVPTLSTRDGTQRILEAPGC